MYSKILINSLFKEIDHSIELITQWNDKINNKEYYYTMPDGEQLLSATCMQLQAIGEGIKKIDKLTESELLKERPDISWREIKGLRDVISHAYFEIDAEIIFNVVKNDLPNLKDAIQYFINLTI